MSASGAPVQSSLMAGLILNAMRRGNLTELETGLEVAERMASDSETVIPAAGEQLELLGAVAGQMRQSISRFHRHLTPHLEGMEVSMQLLSHLAGASRNTGTSARCSVARAS